MCGVAARRGLTILCIGGWLVLPVLLAGEGRGPVPAAVPANSPGPSPPLQFQTVLETEQSARLLAMLLYAGRYVITENQDLFDNPALAEKGFTPDVFERQLAEMFRVRSGIDLRDLDASRLPEGAKRLLRLLVAVSRQVVAEAQPEINRSGVGYKGFIPAVFGARVAHKFAELTGVKLKQTALAPRNPANAPDAFERAALEEFADPAHPKEGIISEVTVGGRALRLMFPLYATRRCLDCHGEPKGAPDRTGHPREGLRLGQSAGAISVEIPVGP
ncbi:Tll0287-like domain-containing protein [Nitrospira sp. Kam-Ns4a]